MFETDGVKMVLMEKYSKIHKKNKNNSKNTANRRKNLIWSVEVFIIFIGRIWKTKYGESL